MKTVFIDSEFKCHLENDGTMTAVTTSLFDSACDEKIEGYRFIPSGQTWTREDGTVFSGEMITPWKPYSELDDAQLDYECGLIAEYSSALSEIERTIESGMASGDMTTFPEARKQAILSRIQDMLTALETMEVTPE